MQTTSLDPQTDALGTYDSGPLLFSARIIVDRHHSKKNRKIIVSGKRNSGASKGRRGLFIKSTPEVESCERSVVLHLRSRANELSLDRTICDPVRALFKFYYPKTRFFTKLKRPSLILPDISNLYELPQDSLSKAKIIEDDWQIKSHDGSRILWHDSEEHVIEIYLYKYTGTELLWIP